MADRRRGNGDHVLAVVEGATEKRPFVRQGVDPTLPRLFIVGAKALSKAIRNTFGVAGNHPALPGPRPSSACHLHAKKAQAWDQDDANKVAARLVQGASWRGWTGLGSGARSPGRRERVHGAGEMALRWLEAQKTFRSPQGLSPAAHPPKWLSRNT